MNCRLLKIVSSLVALIMVLSMVCGLFTFDVLADDEETTDSGTASDKASDNEEGETGEEEEEIPDYTNPAYGHTTAADKLQSIKDGIGTGENMSISSFGSTLYCDTFSGEIIWQNDTTGEMLLTNPYDVANRGTASNIDTKYELLSQIILTYDDNGTTNTMYSYVEACQRKQINVKYIKNGLRVEYSMGREEARKLVPRLIEKSRFEDLILSKVEDERDREKLLTYYILQDQNDETKTEAQKQDMLNTYPITRDMAVYSFDSEASDRELTSIEGIIKSWAKEYTYDDMNDDHIQTNYEGNDAAPALFKLALEYTLCEDGTMTVRLAASGIRYDEDNYKLQTVSILPNFGATSDDYDGYTFIPDGSGATIENKDIIGSRYTISGKVYGTDYAYHEISGANQEIMRLPVFGTTQNWVEVEKYEYVDDISGQTVKGTRPTGKTERSGYFAIIEEGDSVATITSNHGGSVTNKYNSVYTTFTPRASDTYDLSSSLSVGGNSSYTVLSRRKYTGNYTLRFYMLADPSYEEKLGDRYYESTYVGMAKSYQHYLESRGEITPLTKDDVDDDLPLYIESFGTIDTDDTVLSIPVTVKTPLTTFDDLKTMYSELSENGIKNIKYRLTGFTNGGVLSTSPYHVKFEKKVGGNSGYKEFLEYANENKFEVYPDFDFMYVKKTSAFDGFDMKKQAIKTIDSRYTQKRSYSAIYQSFQMTGLIAVSAPSVSDIYDNFNKEYSKFGSGNVSVSTLASDLNSDFDRKDPYDRNDSKIYIENILKRVGEDYENVMADGGNAYSIKHIDHILNVPLDSSRYAMASHAVPFTALVLHGYKQYSGSATNMASDSGYEMLKMIENGSNPYYILSYQNLSKLKEDEELNKYYSVSFTIWKDDLIKTYNTLNKALSDLQTEKIVNHEFIAGERQLTDDEYKNAQKIAAAEAEAEAKKKQEEAEKKALHAQRAAWVLSKFGEVLEDEGTDDSDTTADSEIASTVAVDIGTIVRVTYSNGAEFYINYNEFPVVTENGVSLEANSFVRID